MSQSLIGELKLVAPLNILAILVTPLVFQLFIDAWPIKFVAPSKAEDILVTADKSGTSSAVNCIFIIPLKADIKLDHWISPHCLISKSLAFSSSCNPEP